MPSTRDWDDHKIRRRFWDHGFSQKSLKSYEPRILHTANEMINSLAKLEGKTLNMSAWFDYFTFDVMGDLAFNESFHMLSGGPTIYGDMIRRGMQAFHSLSGVSWLNPIALYLPLSSEVKKQAQEFRKLAKSLYQKRRAQGTEPNDLFTHLLSTDKNQNQTSEPDLEADASAIIVAGAETTSITLTFLFYLLSSNLAEYQKLQEEVDRVWDGISVLEGNSLEAYPYLSGCIYEALRIFPPGPNGMQRRTGKEGHMVDGTYVPPFTQVSSNTLRLHHDPRNFSNPLAFVPDRWSETTRDPSWNHDTRAWIPFTGGTFSCASRALALLELRLLTTMLLKKFTFRQSLEFSNAKFLGDLRSYQSLVKAALLMNVEERDDSKE